MNLNQATIVGRVVRDPEIRSLPSGKQVASLSVATSRTWKQEGQKKEETEFHNMVAFGKTAEIIGQYVKKGQLIAVVGRIQTRSWEKDGQKKYRTEIIVETMQMGPKPAGSKAAPAKDEGPDTNDPGRYPAEGSDMEDLPF